MALAQRPADALPPTAVASLPAVHVAAASARLLGSVDGLTYFVARESAGAICLLTVGAGGSLLGSNCVSPSAFAANGLQAGATTALAWLIPSGWASAHGPVPGWAVVSENLLVKRP